MSYQLIAEVYEHVPRAFPQGERSVLLVIAGLARVEQRTCELSRAELSLQAGLTLDELQTVLHRLRDCGIDVCVPGTVTTYRLPDLARTARAGRAGRGCRVTVRDRHRQGRRS